MADLTLDQLTDHLGSPVHALDLLEKLFSACRLHAEEIAHYRSGVGIRLLEDDARDAVATSLNAVLSDARPTSGSTLRDIALHESRVAQPDLPPSVIARAMLWGVASGAYDEIWNGLRARRPGVITLGQCFPMPLPNYPERLRIDLGPGVPVPKLPPNPDRKLEERSAAVPLFDCADAALLTRFELHFDYRFASSLDLALGPGLPEVATVHPNDSGWELIPPGFVLDQENRTWFGAGPSDGAHIEQIRQLLISAHERGASICIVPELSQSDTHSLFERWHGPGRPPIVVSGSSHVTIPDDRGRAEHLNIAAVVIGGITAFVHRKFRPYQFEFDEVEYREDLTMSSRPTLSFLCASDWTMTALICADANDGDTAAQLRHAGANLILVAAWTPKRGYFSPHLRYLGAGDRQAIVAIANGPNDMAGPANEDPAPVAMFLTPWSSDDWHESIDAPDRIRVFTPATGAIR